MSAIEAFTTPKTCAPSVRFELDLVGLAGPHRQSRAVDLLDACRERRVGCWAKRKSRQGGNYRKRSAQKPAR